MAKFTVTAAGLSFIALLGFSPSPERVAKIVPFVQVPALVFTAVNNGLQAAKQLEQRTDS